MYSLKEKSLILQDRVKSLALLIKNFEGNNKDAEKFGLTFLNDRVAPIKELMDGISTLSEDMSNEINEMLVEEINNKEEQL